MSHIGRRGVLAAFALLVLCTQVLWLSYAPISSRAAADLGVSVEAVGDLAIINPLLYVLLAIPTGRWMDRHFSAALAAGAVCTGLGAAVRVLAPHSFALALVGQVIFSIGQPLVLNASTKVPARYFPPGERTAAISVTTAAQFVGVLVAALSTGALYDAGGLCGVVGGIAVVSLAAMTAMLVGLRVPAAYPGDPVLQAVSWRRLRHDRLLWRLAVLLFIGIGLFNAVATWLDAILADFGTADAGGVLIAVMTVAGIVGAAVLPDLAARRSLRREVLMTATGATVVIFLALAVLHGVVVVGVALAVEGFVLLAGLPVALDWSELESGPDLAGTATGLLLLAGNLGGVVLVLFVQVLLQLGSPQLGLLGLAALGVPGVLVAARLPRHARAHGEARAERRLRAGRRRPGIGRRRPGAAGPVAARRGPLDMTCEIRHSRR